MDFFLIQMTTLELLSCYLISSYDRFCYGQFYDNKYTSMKIFYWYLFGAHFCLLFSSYLSTFVAKPFNFLLRLSMENLLFVLSSDRHLPWSYKTYSTKKSFFSWTLTPYTFFNVSQAALAVSLFCICKYWFFSQFKHIHINAFT